MKYSDFRFAVELGFISALFSIFGGLVLSSFNLVSPFMSFSSRSEELVVLIGSITIYPLIETILGQLVPIKLGKLFTKRTTMLVILSALVFSLSHLISFSTRVPIAKLLVVFPPGIVFAWSYIVKSGVSFRRGFWITTAIHSFSNLLLIIFFLFLFPFFS